MIKYNFIKTLTAGIALATAIYPQAFAADTCPSGYDTSDGKCFKTGDCGTNCVYIHDYKTSTITYTGTGENGAGIISVSNQYMGLSGSIRNIIVEEGITDILDSGRDRETFNTVGDGTGKLVLPSTLKAMDRRTAYDLKFAIVELNSKNITFGSQEAFGLTSANTTLIVNSDININGTFQSWNSMHPGRLDIKCKGSTSQCQEKMGEIVQYFKDKGTIVSYNYYKGLDENGTYVEYNDDGLFKFDEDGNVAERWNWAGNERYSLDGKLLLASYDADGNMTSYKYDGAGNLTAAYENGVSTYKRTSYTPAEAAAAVKKGNNNKVTLTFK